MADEDKLVWRNRVEQARGGVRTDVDMAILSADAELTRLREESEAQRSIDKYMAKRYDEISAVAEKHWESYWEELGKRKELESRVAQLEGAVEWACGDEAFWMMKCHSPSGPIIAFQDELRHRAGEG